MRKFTLNAGNTRPTVLYTRLYLNNIYTPHLKCLNWCHRHQPHNSKHESSEVEAKRQLAPTSKVIERLPDSDRDVTLE